MVDCPKFPGIGGMFEGPRARAMSWTARLRLQEPSASGHAGAADRKAFHPCRKRPDLYCPNPQGSGPLASLVPHRYEIGIGQIIEKRHVNERRNEQYEDHSGERYSQATRAEQPFRRSEEHTSELQSLMRNSYAVFCLKKKT